MCIGDDLNPTHSLIEFSALVSNTGDKPVITDDWEMSIAFGKDSISSHDYVMGSIPGCVSYAPVHSVEFKRGPAQSTSITFGVSKPHATIRHLLDEYKSQQELITVTLRNSQTKQSWQIVGSASDLRKQNYAPALRYPPAPNVASRPPAQPLEGATPPVQSDPEKELLAAAQKMQFNLCNFQREWELQYQEDRSRAAFGMPNGQIDQKELAWLKSIQYPEKSSRYATDYQSDAMTLRAQLIKEVPGVALEDAQYDNVHSPGAFDAVYWDFHNLVLAFNTKLSTGTYQQIVDEGRPQNPATCKPLLGLQNYIKLPSGSYTPAPEPQ